MTADLAGKTAIVTGASRGIGAAAAQRLAASGCRVALIARSLDDLKAVADGINAGHPGSTTAIACDVTDAAAVSAAAAQAETQLGPIDILVNNAGGFVKAGPLPFELVSDTDFERSYSLNFLSAVRFARAVLPNMQTRNWGRIVTISSEVALQPDPVGADYAAAKSALHAFSKSISKEYGASGITANVIAPAFIMTSIVRGMIQDMAQSSGAGFDAAAAQFMRAVRPNINVGRAGAPEDVANAIAFLASDQAAFINGAILRVDGGSVASV